MRRSTVQPLTEKEALSLLQDKAAAEVQFLEDAKRTEEKQPDQKWYNFKKYDALSREAKKAESKLKKYLFVPGATISAKDFVAAINKHHFFFRGLTVTGDVDLSQLRNKYLVNLDLGNTIFEGKFTASGVKLESVNCQGAIFKKNAVFDGADIRDVNFKDVKFEADFHINQKTKVGKRGKLLDSSYQTNERTQQNHITFELLQTNIGFNLASGQKQVCIHQKPLKELDVALFLTQFENAYTEVCAKDVFKKFRGNLVDRLNKKNPPLSDVEKIYEIVRHAQKEPSGRVNRALEAILPRFVVRSDPVVRDETTAVPSRDETTTVTSLDEGSASNKPPVFFDNTTQPDVADVTQQITATLTSFYDGSLCGLSSEQLQKKQNSFLEEKKFLQACDVNNEKLNKKIEEAIQKAKKTLDAALSDFKKSDYLFGESSINNAIKRGQEQTKVVASYLFLKIAGETEAIAQYNKQLKEVIYPNYLRYALRPETERNGTAKFRYNLTEELFVRSGVVNEAGCLAVVSDRRNEVSGGAGFFAKKESSSKAVFEKSCLKRWANIPLIDLKQAGLVEPVIFDAVQEKMTSVAVDDQNRLRIERIFYLEELIKCEKFDDAIREAKAIEAVYDAKLATYLAKALNNAVSEIKCRIVTESKKMLADHRPDSDSLLGKDRNHLLNKSDKIFSVRDAALKDIFAAVGGCVSVRSDVGAICSAIYHGVTNTYVLKTIADNVLTNRPIDYQLLLALDPMTASNYYPVVWVGKQHERDAFVQRLNEAMEKENGGNSSRFELLQGLRNCIGGMNSIDELLKIPLEIDKVTTKLQHDDVILMHRGAIGTQYVMQLLEKAFEPLWGYGPIQKAVMRHTDGSVTFADPKNPVTKTLISESMRLLPFQSRPETNFKKYELIVTLYDALSMFRENLSHDDIVRDRNHHEKITQNFAQLLSTLLCVQDAIQSIDRTEKTFETLVQGVFKAATEAQHQWLTYCSGIVINTNLSQCPDKKYTRCEVVPYTL